MQVITYFFVTLPQILRYEQDYYSTFRNSVILFVR